MTVVPLEGVDGGNKIAGNRQPDMIFELCRTGTQELQNMYDTGKKQGGRTWQPFVGSKNGNENFCPAHSYNFASNASFLRVIANLQN